MKFRTTQEEITVHSGIIKAIGEHSQQQYAKGGYEAVGLLAQRDHGDDLRVVATVPLHNHAADPQHAFFVEPWEEYRAYKRLQEKGYKVVGSYHSHPTGEALPSQADHQLARPNTLMFIYSVTFEELKGYRKEDDTLIPVLLIEEED